VFVSWQLDAVLFVIATAITIGAQVIFQLVFGELSKYNGVLPQIHRFLKSLISMFVS